MKISKKLLIAACATIGAYFLGANTYAQESVTIDDPDFYAALKNCAQNGLNREGFYEAASMIDGTDVNALRDFYRNTLYCGNMDQATFDDATRTISIETSFADSIWMPNQGLKNIDDINKFERFQMTPNFMDNEIEYVEFDDTRAFLAGNPLKKMPDYLIQDLDREPNRETEHALGLFSAFVTDVDIEDEYTDDSYELPQIISDIQLVFGKLADGADYWIDRLDSENPTYDDGLAYYNAYKTYYNADKWLYLENATLSEDGKTLKAIDPTKDMLISYRQPWDEMLVKSPYLNPCPYPNYGYSSVTCVDGRPVDMDTDMPYLEIRAFQSSDEYAHIITIKVKSNNPSNPNTSDSIKLIGAISAASTLISGTYVYRKTQR